MARLLIKSFFICSKEPEASKDHHLSLDKKSFDSINNIIVELTDNQQLSPLLISWATVRYLVQK